MKEINQTDCDIRIRTEPEFMEVRGNAMDSGDKEADKAYEDSILERLEDGDEWAWCIVIVSVEWMGMVEEVYLGGCSYENLQDFCKNSMYYEDMISEALDNLNKKAKAIAEAIA